MRIQKNTELVKIDLTLKQCVYKGAPFWLDLLKVKFVVEAKGILQEQWKHGNIRLPYISSIKL